MYLRKQDVPVLMLHYLGFSRLALLVSRVRKRPVVRFITFHDIPDAAVERFREKLLFLKERTNVVSIDDYLAGKLSTERPNLVVTFDDGYKSWHTEAARSLKALAIPATFFISSGFVGSCGEREREFVHIRLKTHRKTTGALSEEDVKSLARQGFVIGGHTCNHVNLSELRDKATIYKEIGADKRRLEQIVGAPVSHFAYPFGSFSNSLVSLSTVLEEIGYRTAVTTDSGTNTGKTDRFVLRRELTDAQLPLVIFKARVYGNQDAVRFLKWTIEKPSKFVSGSLMRLTEMARITSQRWLAF